MHLGLNLPWIRRIPLLLTKPFYSEGVNGVEKGDRMSRFQHGSLFKVPHKPVQMFGLSDGMKTDRETNP